ncbi:MAG: NAD-dependent epimerase/dehydratase family protein [SAR324 cluster bacterium]|nr:NAD-dependent epimerase/dehydratase family protein [SAR324 cluster bacterium]
MKAFVTGGAGFIGSNLVDRLLSLNHDVVVYDNLSTGRLEFLEEASTHGQFRFIQGDLLDPDTLRKAMEGSNFVFHLSANADVRFGTDHPEKDLQQNTIATFNVLEAMRANSVQKIAFSSTGSIYGEAPVIPTPEDCALPVQTSLYGASKLACEGLISAYCEGFGMQGWIFRFVSILGERYTHGHVFDFYKKLRDNPNELFILGDGHQKKSYLYVQDCLDAILTATEKAQEAVNIFNLGTDEYIQVTQSVGFITRHLGLQPELKFAGGERGWIGDNPFIFLDCSKIRRLGSSPRFTIEKGIIKTLKWLQENAWVLEKRESL